MRDRPQSIPPDAPGGTRNTTARAERKAQHTLMKTAGKLAVLRAVLWRLHIRLGEGPDDAHMGENLMPDSVRVSVRGTIECVCIDCLDSAIDSLHKTALDTPESLAIEWRERLKGRPK